MIYSTKKRKRNEFLSQAKEIKKQKNSASKKGQYIPI
jgi:hypothetical protein